MSCDRFLTDVELKSKLNAAVCLECGDILVSKHTHDYVVCSCPNFSMVDGGPDYRKRGGKDLSKVVTVYTLESAQALSAAVKGAPKWKDICASPKKP